MRKNMNLTNFLEFAYSSNQSFKNSYLIVTLKRIS